MKKTLLKAVALSAVVSLSAVNFGFAAGGSVGYGNISVYKNDKLVTRLSGQNPVEDGALLVCDGKCMVKSEGISLIGEDASRVAVASEDDTFKIFLKEGKVDYVISSNVRKITFYTPQGQYTVADVVFNANSSSVVKGSIFVDNKGQTEISVTEGRMIFATADGMKAVDANNKIVLAVAVEGGAAAATATGAGAAAGTAAVTAGTAVATGAATIGGIGALGAVGVVGLAGVAAVTSVDNASDSGSTAPRSASASKPSSVSEPVARPVPVPTRVFGPASPAR